MRPAGPEAELMLLSAGTAARRARSRTRAGELAQSVDWDLLTARLAARRLLPQLGPRVLELCGSHVPVRFSRAHELALEQARRQAALLGLLGSRLVQALAQEGIRALTLKGPFLGEAIYGDPGRRPAADIDLLVAPADLQRAVALARGAGYDAPIDSVDGEGLPLLHLALRHEQGRYPPLELHWRVHWYERDFAREMLDAAEPGPQGELRARPADELACLLLCYARDGFLGLRLASDLGAWWDAFGEHLPDGALSEIIERHPAIAPALLAAATVSAQVVGLPAERLTGGRALGLRPRLACRLANPSAVGNPAQLSADAGLIDWLLTPPGAQREFISRQLLPAREVLELRSRFSGERRVSPLGHGARVLPRYALTLARLAVAPRGRALGADSRQAHRTPFSGPASTSTISL
jgi:Uncharacterised nucleotidyltransferase